MLEVLRIQNIVLIDNVEVHFGSGFHVLSGETGAGKSALLQALALVTGVKADLSLLRQGSKQGFVEAVFSPRSDETWKHLLQDAGLTWHPDEPIVLRRELALPGKTRAFYNDQLITQTLLKQIGTHCLEIVGQQATHNVRALNVQREFVDTYGTNLPLLMRFQQAFQKEKASTAEWQLLFDTEPERLRQREIIERERGELKRANLQEEEEEQLIAEHDRMQHARELFMGLEAFSHRMGDRERSLISLAQREKHALERLMHFDPALADVVSAMERVQIEVQEIDRSIERAMAKIEFQPQRLEQLEQRLQEIHQLKKRYGPTFALIIAHQEKLEKQFQQLEEADRRQIELKELLNVMRNETEEAATKLTHARNAQLKPFAKELQGHLELLNMPKVQVDVRRHPRARCQHGDEDLEIFFLPNFGEKELPISESSGGELSRIHLSLQMVLSGKSTVSSLVFDEIDANIGGATAKVVGEMLANVGQHTQVLCITHFPQVARYATHHLQIMKVEDGGRTLTKVTSLSQEERRHELARMMGTTT